jgi:hypothetical protein
MKTMTKILIISAFLLAGCDDIISKRSGNCVGLIIDISDTLKVVNSELTIEKVEPMFTLDQDYNSSAKCQLATINDIRYTEVSVINIEGDRLFSSNLIQRDTLIKSFYQDIEKNIKNIKNQPKGTKGSFVCYSIAKMLTDIVNCEDCINKKVIVLSDLAENTPAFNIYKEADRRLIEKNPKAFYKLLDREYPVPNLNGIELVFVNRPPDSTHDEQYHLLSQSLKTYYQDRGAKVTITASLPE